MSLFESIAQLIIATVGNVYRWICVFMAVLRCLVDRLPVLMQQICRKLVFELGHTG